MKHRQLTEREWRKVKNNPRGIGWSPSGKPGTCTNQDCARWLRRKGYKRLAAQKRPCILCEANERAASRSGK